MTERPPLKDYAQAAEWLGVPVRWLQDRVQRGEVPYTRLGKHVRFTQEHLDVIVKAGEHVPERRVTVVISPEQAALRPTTRRRRRKPLERGEAAGKSAGKQGR